MINCAKDVFEVMYPKLKDLDKEHVFALLLNSKNVIIKEELISVGTFRLV